MKKIKQILLMTLFAITTLLTTGCLKKDAITTKQFEERMSNKGFNIIEMATEDFNNATSYYIADNNLEYQINFLVFDTKYDAEVFVNELYESITEKTNDGLKTSVNGLNYQKNTFKTNTTYTVISQVEETVLQVSTNVEYKEEIENILEELGY